MNSTVVDLTWAWLDAIDRATACLRRANHQAAAGEQRRGSFQQQQQQQQRGPRNANNNNNNSNNSAVEEALNYLILLETVLLEHQLFWDQPPTIPPPEWIIPAAQGPPNTTMVAAPVLPLQPPPGVILQPPLQHPPTVITPPLTRYYSEGSSAFAETNNPFATFQSDDDDDDDVDEDDEAGDQPIYLQQPQQQFVPGRGASQGGGAAFVPPMVLRRVMIRVVTSMSEVYAHKASACRQERPPKWKLGADTYGQSLFKIHQALQLADSEISRLVNHQEQQQQDTDDDWLLSCYDDLVQDADIVEVAIQYLTQERDRYRQAAVQQEQYLIQRLNPQWQARDQARTRMGDDKWVQNPAPKNDYWHRRRQDEYQLRDVQAALAQLNQVDTDVAQATSQKLKTRLKQQRQQRGSGRGSTSRAEPDNSAATNNDATLRIVEQREQRYNGLRPLDYSNRVSWEDYPDPTNHGWTFTGSWEASLVEFFERAMGAEGEVVKLDWYYTTATIKTSLHHPTQGKTQMFANRVTPSVYLEVLQNPRVHTNQRYQTRQHRPNNNNNNRSQYRRQPQQQQQQQR